MNNKQEQEIMEIDLAKLMRYYFSHWKAILTSGIVLAAIAFLYTFFMVTPLYSASVTVYVNNMKGAQSMDMITGGNLSAAQQLVTTYVNIIKSDTVLKKVIETGNLNCQPNAIRKIMTAKQIDDTGMFRVSISHSKPEVAAHIANTIADVAPKIISEFVEGSSTKVIDYAQVPERPYTPNYKKNIVLGAVLGVILMAGLLTLQYLFDMRLQDEDDMRMYFSAPVLGAIPEFEKEESRRAVAHASASRTVKGGARR